MGTGGIRDAFNEAYNVQFLASGLKVDSSVIEAALGVKSDASCKMLSRANLARLVGSAAGSVMCAVSRHKTKRLVKIIEGRSDVERTNLLGAIIQNRFGCQLDRGDVASLSISNNKLISTIKVINNKDATYESFVSEFKPKSQCRGPGYGNWSELEGLLKTRITAGVVVEVKYKGTTYVIAKTTNGIVVQNQDDYKEYGKNPEMFIPDHGNQYGLREEALAIKVLLKWKEGLGEQSVRSPSVGLSSHGASASQKVTEQAALQLAGKHSDAVSRMMLNAQAIANREREPLTKPDDAEKFIKGFLEETKGMSPEQLKRLATAKLPDGSTLLHLFSKTDYVWPEVAFLFEEAAAMLIKNGAKVDSTDSYGRTPLHYAATNLSGIFMEARVSGQELPTREGRTSGSLLYVLAKANADPNINDNEGRTPSEMRKFGQSNVLILHLFSKKISQENLSKIIDACKTASEMSAIVRSHNITLSPAQINKCVELAFKDFDIELLKFLIDRGVELKGRFLLHNMREEIFGSNRAERFIEYISKEVAPLLNEKNAQGLTPLDIVLKDGGQYLQARPGAYSITVALLKCGGRAGLQIPSLDPHVEKIVINQTGLAKEKWRLGASQDAVQAQQSKPLSGLSTDKATEIDQQNLQALQSVLDQKVLFASNYESIFNKTGTKNNPGMQIRIYTGKVNSDLAAFQYLKAIEDTFTELGIEYQKEISPFILVVKAENNKSFFSATDFSKKFEEALSKNIALNVKILSYANKQTFLYNADVSEIPEENRFVSESNHIFDITELAESFARGQIRNPYTLNAFTQKDMQALCAYPEIRQLITSFMNNNASYFAEISDKTLSEIVTFSNNVAMMNNQGFVSDEQRTMALFRFKQYYDSLSETEKNALNNSPAMQVQFQIYGLRRNGFEGMFQLPVDHCLGGTAGVCRYLLEYIDTFKKIAEAIQQAPSALSSDSQSSSKQVAQDVTPSAAKSESASAAGPKSTEKSVIVEYKGKQIVIKPELKAKIDEYIRTRHSDYSLQQAFDRLAGYVETGTLNDSVLDQLVREIVHPSQVPQTEEEKEILYVRRLFESVSQGMNPRNIHKENFKYNQKSEVERIKEHITSHEEAILKLTTIAERPTVSPFVKDLVQRKIKGLKDNIGALQERLKKEEKKAASAASGVVQSSSEENKTTQIDPVKRSLELIAELDVNNIKEAESRFAEFNKILDEVPEGKYVQALNEIIIGLEKLIQSENLQAKKDSLQRIQGHLKNVADDAQRQLDDRTAVNRASNQNTAESDVKDVQQAKQDASLAGKPAAEQQSKAGGAVRSSEGKRVPPPIPRRADVSQQTPSKGVSGGHLPLGQASGEATVAERVLKGSSSSAAISASVNNDAQRVENAGARIQTRPGTERLSDQVEIFVERFLHPYITGQITPETEPHDRKPMMQLLMLELRKTRPTEPLQQDKIEEMAYRAYVKQAAKGLFMKPGRHDRTSVRRVDIHPNTIRDIQVEIEKTERVVKEYEEKRAKGAQVFEWFLDGVKKDLKGLRERKEAAEQLQKAWVDALMVAVKKDFLSMKSVSREAIMADGFKAIEEVESENDKIFEEVNEYSKRNRQRMKLNFHEILAPGMDRNPIRQWQAVWEKDMSINPYTATEEAALKMIVEIEQAFDLLLNNVLEKEGAPMSVSQLMRILSNDYKQLQGLLDKYKVDSAKKEQILDRLVIALEPLVASGGDLVEGAQDVKDRKCKEIKDRLKGAG